MRKIAVLLIFTLQSSVCFSSHLKGGEITIRYVSGLTWEITLTAYADTESAVYFGGGTLAFGDGSPNTTVPLSSSVPTDYPGVGIVRFTTPHTYAGPGFYKVSYFEHNLDDGILNLFNSAETPFFIESGLNADPLNNPNYSFPKFEASPIFVFPIKRAYAFSTALVDSGHRYTYQLVDPMGAQSYRLPESFLINANTGLISWDTKFLNAYHPGEYYFMAKISQYDENGNQLGYVTRGFQVILEDRDSRILTSNPITDPDGRIVVLENQQQTIKLVLQDSTVADTVYWNAYLDQKLAGNVSFTQYDSFSVSRRMKVALVTLYSTPDIIRNYPYLISLRGTSGFQKDVNFLFFTKDIPLPPVVTGLPIRTEKEISLYPNPFTNFIYFNGLGSAGCTLRVINLPGQEILQTHLDPGEPMDASLIPPGVYIFQINDGLTSTRHKGVKK